MNAEITRRRMFLSQRKNRGKRLTIGFTGIADFRSFIGQEYIAGIMKAAADYDINLINMTEAIKYSLFSDMDFMAHYLKKFRFMRAPLIDGLVTWASSLADNLTKEQIVERFSALKPLPMVDIGYLDIPGVPSLRIDNSCSMRLIIDHMVTVHQASRFVFFGSKATRPHHTRLEFFRHEMQARNLPFSDEQVYMASSLTPPDIATQVDALCTRLDLHKRQSVDVIVTSSDVIAATLIDELEKRGIHVPGDVAVTGFNNQYNGITALSPVTTINLEYYKRGYAAVEQLIDCIIASTNPHAHIATASKLLQTSLIVRESCGCFERNIIEAGNHEMRQNDALFDSTASEADARAYLFEQINRIFTMQSHKSKEDLVDAIFEDMYDFPSPPRMLNWFRVLLRKKREGSEDTRALDYQQKITDVRRVLLQVVQDNDAQRTHIEDICNQLRVLFSTTRDYDMLARRQDTYFFNSMTQAALNFATATTSQQIKNVLRYQLNEMKIPGITLVLNNTMTTDIIGGSIDLILPEPPEDIRQKLPFRVHDPALFPQTFLPTGKRYTVMLELLYHADRYLGYAFFTMGSRNISLYDSIRQLLSHALYTVYTREGRTKEHAMMVNRSQLFSVLHIQDSPDDDLLPRSKLTVGKIVAYLIEHLNEMTDLNKMADAFLLSKSQLVRQTKKLTGKSIQALHEQLKIEQAKHLLQLENLRLSDIATQLGFQNQNYFSTVFKKNTGLSPRAWIKTINTPPPLNYL